MSTFLGFIEEIPGVSVDCFQHENRQTSKWFFLSHCHTDHMRGLSRCLPGPLYATALTAIFLKKRFSFATEIIVLEMETPTLVVSSEDLKLIVTALPAHHCPGSAMLLFETANSTVLYTGDIRLRKDDFHKLAVLREKHIDSAYLDTTFMYERYLFFPPLLDSINEIVKLSQDWLQRSKSHRVIIENAASHGSEYLFIELSRKLQCKIYVEPELWESYGYVPEVERCVSKNAHECQILTKLKRKSFDFPLVGYKYRTIIPSALRWTNWRPGDHIAKREATGIFRVIISYHSSLSELRDFVEFVRPKQLRSNVSPSREDDKFELLENMRSVLRRNSTCDGNITNFTPFKFDKIFSLIADETAEKPKESAIRLLPKRTRL